MKSLITEHHLVDLEECFQTLWKFHVKLNPIKCPFGVSARKFLGYIVHHSGIEVNPVKVKAILDVLTPMNIKEVHSLTRRIAALGRFFSQSAEKGLPFYKALSKAKNFV